VAVVWESNEVPSFYVDGVQVSTVRSGTVSGIYDNSGSSLYIGKNEFSSGNDLDGAVDEAHISDVVRPSGWIRTEYNNQRNPSSFYTVGSENGGSEPPPPPPPPPSGSLSISDPYPANYAENVPTSLSGLSFYIYDPNGLPMEYWVVTSPTIGTGYGTQLGNGRYTVPVSGLENGKTYWWTIQLSNGQTEIARTYKFTTGDDQPPPPPPPPPPPTDPSSDILGRYLINNLGDLSYAEQIELAENIDLINTKPYPVNKVPMQNIRAANPDIIIICYYNTWAINDQTSDIRIARQNGWVLRDALGREVYAKGWPNNKIMDVGNQGFRDWLAGKIKAVVDEYGFDGIMGDGTKAILEDTYDISAMPINPRTGRIFTPTEWRNAMIGHVRTIKARMGPDKILIANGKGANVGCNEFGFWANQDLVEPLIDEVDGNLMEGFIRWINEKWRSESKWVQDVNFLKYLCDKGKIAIPLTNSHGILPPGATAEQVIMYGLVTNLLALEPGYSYVGFSVIDREDLYDLTNIQIGTPTQDYVKRSGMSVYQRAFTNGLAMINPSDNSYTFNLGSYYYTLSGARINSITIRPHTGVILLKTLG
jgi:hypothetical protein